MITSMGYYTNVSMTLGFFYDVAAGATGMTR
jgi:hypothetical protein